MMTFKARAASRKAKAARSFTLTELLAAMGIIAIIAGVTAVSVRTIARDAKLSSASNTVAAALDTARGIAIRDNRHTVLVFRARPSGGSNQYIELITAQSVGNIGDHYPDTDAGVVERFVPVPGISVRRLPAGIQVATPLYLGEKDNEWAAASHLPATPSGEAGGVVIAVMYGPDGRVRMRRDDASADRYFVDFNNDGFQQYDQTAYLPDNLPSEANDEYCDFGMGWSSQSGGSMVPVPLVEYFCQRQPDDEPYLATAPFLAIFDGEKARDEFDTSLWTDGAKRVQDLTEFINNNADRIHFNRYTGVVLR